MAKSNKYIAVCGIDCSECDIYKAAEDPQIAERIANWFTSERNIKVKPEDVRCMGCRGGRDKHWSPDCWIRECCFEKKGLNYCSECDQFPCNKLAEWSKTDPGYTNAFERLTMMNQQRRN